jgi:hypothetical protein
MEGGREIRRAPVVNIVLVVLGALGYSPLALRAVETRKTLGAERPSGFGLLKWRAEMVP